jgi:hypothetical protein
MDVSTCLKEYKNIGDYFSQDYERDNEALFMFKQANPELSTNHVSELKAILENTVSIKDKYFVADLLYRFV